MSQSTFLDFARGHLPAPPATVLEVGCGQGELTVALVAAGYDVLGVDPLAPLGDSFRRIRLEDLEGEAAYDAVVAARSLHPIRDLDYALDRIVALLRPDGLLVVEELAWDLIDEPTLEWLWGQRRALAAAGRGDAPATVAELREEWLSARLGIHGFDALRGGLASRFEELEFAWAPFLYRQLGGVASEVLEQALIDAGAIRPLGFRYAGRRR